MSGLQVLQRQRINLFEMFGHAQVDAMFVQEKKVVALNNATAGSAQLINRLIIYI